MSDEQLKSINSSLAASVLRLGNECRSLAEENARLKAEVERLKEGNDCLDKMHEKEMERSAWLREEFNRTTAWGRGLESDLSHARVEISFLKAENERLKKPAIIGGYNISEYIRMANSETLEFDNGDIFADMTLPERIKYIVESHARLKAEVSVLEGRVRYWKIEAECDHGRWLRCLEDLEHLRNLK